MVQRVKDLVLLQLWHRSQLQFRFNPWPENYHMPRVWLKKQKREREREPSKDAYLWPLRDSDTLIKKELIPRRYKTLGLKGENIVEKGSGHSWTSV